MLSFDYKPRILPNYQTINDADHNPVLETDGNQSSIAEGASHKKKRHKSRQKKMSDSKTLQPSTNKLIKNSKQSIHQNSKKNETTLQSRKNSTSYQDTKYNTKEPPTPSDASPKNASHHITIVTQNQVLCSHSPNSGSPQKTQEEKKKSIDIKLMTEA